MKSKGKIGILLILLAVVGVIGALGEGIKGAEALQEVSDIYYLSGEYTWVEDGPYGLHKEGGGIGSEIRHGSVLVAKLRMESEGNSGEFYESAMDTIFNFSWYLISALTYKETSGSSLIIKKNGSIVINESLSGALGVLYSAPLEDGNYEINLSFSYKPTTTSICVFNYTYRFGVDGTAPAYSLKANGVDIASGSYTNGLVRYSSSDINYHEVLYKAPGSAYKVNTGISYYEISTSGLEGTWYFYSRDGLNNISPEVSVNIDRSAPIGKIFLESGVELTTGYSKSKVRFTYSENMMIDRLEIKVGSGSWIAYSAGTYITEAGTYCFRAIDKAGNVSVEKSVIIDFTPPSVYYYVDSTEVISGSETSGTKVKATSLDYLSGVKEMYVKRPGENNFSIYLMGTELVGEGKYYFYAKDNSGNLSEQKSIYIDNTAPTLTAFYGNEQLVWGGYTSSESIRVESVDNISSEISIFVKVPGASSYVSYLGENLNGYGEYLFKASDKAGNESAAHRIIRDDVSPLVRVVDETEQDISGEYSNVSAFQIVGSDELSPYVDLRFKEPGASAFSAYLEGTLLNKEGRYEIFGIDSAQNESSRIYLSLDRTTPQGVVYSLGAVLTNEYTNTQYVSYYGEDYSDIAYAYIKRPGSSAYEVYLEGSEVGASGEYLFKCVDNAGNESNERRVVLDREAPYVTLEIKGMMVPYGSISKDDFLCFGNDNFGINKVYIKAPLSETYTQYFGEVLFGEEGTSYIYVEDLAGNISDAISFTVDKSLPVGEIKSLEDEVIEGQYTKLAFKYLASDSNGIKLMQWKTPGSSNWAQYNGTNISSGENGEYVFRCFDFADNLSEEESVFFDNTCPIVHIETEQGISEKRYLSAEYMLFVSSDNGSGIKEQKVIMPGQNEFINLGINIKIFGEGEYSFVAFDMAGNESIPLVVTLDRTIPKGDIYQNTSLLKSGSYTNQSFYYDGTDAHSYIHKAYIKYPNSSNWETYIKDTDFSGDELEGEYFFKCEDVAGNFSEVVSVIYDNTIPEGNIYVCIDGISSPAYPSDFEMYYGEGYSTREAITYFSSDSDVFSIAVKLPGAKDFTPFSVGSILSGEGEYVFKCVDNAGNYSFESNINLDRTPPVITIEGLENIDEIGFIRVVVSDATSLSVNGKEILPGEIIQTIYQGRYIVLAADLAGNESRTFFESYYEMGIEKYPLEKWFEVELETGTISYASYEGALDANLNEEADGIIFASWATGEIWNTGVMMDSVDSINAKPGEYYIYKSASDPSVAAAYFTQARIYEVALSYAERKIQEVKYFEKDPAAPSEWEKIYYSIADDNLILKKIDVVEGTRCFVDSEEIIGEYSLPGIHTVEFQDKYSNSLTRQIKIVVSSPDIYLRLGESIVSGEGLSGYIKATSDVLEYFFPDGLSIAINEETEADSYFYVKNIDGNIAKLVGRDERISLSESGKYYIGAVNRYSFSREVLVYISNTPGSVEFSADNTLKRLNVLLIPSSDIMGNITSVRIEKSIDGTNFQLLSADDYGVIISNEVNNYGFRTSGKYKVSIEDRFRSGPKAYFVEYTYIKPMPEGTLSGVEIGGITNGTVRFTWTDEARSYLEKKGSLKVNYEKGSEITEEGEYTITLTDYDNNIAEYPFSIKTSAPVVNATGVDNGGKTNEPVTLSTASSGISCEALRNGESFNYVPGESLTAPGIYEMRFVDAAGNETIYSFEITESEKSQSYLWIIGAAVVGLGIILIIIKRKFSGFRRKRKLKKI